MSSDRRAHTHTHTSLPADTPTQHARAPTTGPKSAGPGRVHAAHTHTYTHKHKHTHKHTQTLSLPLIHNPHNRPHRRAYTAHTRGEKLIKACLTWPNSCATGRTLLHRNSLQRIVCLPHTIWGPRCMRVWGGKVLRPPCHFSFLCLILAFLPDRCVCVCVCVCMDVCVRGCVGVCVGVCRLHTNSGGENAFCTEARSRGQCARCTLSGVGGACGTGEERY